MKKIAKGNMIAAAVVMLAAFALLVVGVWGLTLRGGDFAGRKLTQMRTHAVMRVAAEGIIDEIALQAKKEARAFADANKYSRNQKAAYASEQEDLARAEAQQRFAQFLGVDSGALESSIAALYAARRDYAAAEAQEKAVYAQNYLANQASATEAPQDAAVAVEGEAILEDTVPASGINVDYAGFAPSEGLQAGRTALDSLYSRVYLDMQTILPDLRDDMKQDLQAPIEEVIYTHGDNFEKEYDRYAQADAERVLAGDDKTRMSVARSAEDALAIGIGLVLAALTVLFYKELSKRLGMPRLIIMLFFILLLILGALYGISVSGMLGDTLKRTGMYGVLALAMLPGIQSGISLNMGMTIGIISGLLSTVLVLEYNMTGWTAFILAVIGGILLALPVGWAYGKLLNRLKGSEMTVSTYVGFSYVSLMCIAWMLLPFKNAKLTWAMGTGLRTMHNMRGSFGQILDSFGAFKLFGTPVPTGLLLFFLLCCLLVYLYTRTKTGTAMIAAGSNPRFAEASGISVDRMRIIGTTISTVIAAVGIIVYAQSFGFMQLYNGPRQMGFVAASAILIGGASVSRAKISNVIIGTFLFQGVLAMGIQVANAVISIGGLSEVMRILISNGIILYALTQSGGEQRA